jgi:hypothetical protein
MAGGRLADVRGRRLVGTIALISLAIGNVIVFSVAGPGLWGAKLVTSILAGMAVPALGVYAAELFPTSRRGGANGGISALSVVGSVVGLLLAGFLLDQGVTYGRVMAVLAVGPLIYAALVVFAYPETARRPRRHQPRGPHQGDSAPRSGAEARVQDGRGRQPGRHELADATVGAFEVVATAVDPLVGDRAGIVAVAAVSSSGEPKDPRPWTNRRGTVSVGDARCADCPGGPAGAAGRRRGRGPRPGARRRPPSSTCARPSTGRRARADRATRPARPAPQRLSDRAEEHGRAIGALRPASR